MEAERRYVTDPRPFTNYLRAYLYAHNLNVAKLGIEPSQFGFRTLPPSLLTVILECQTYKNSLKKYLYFKDSTLAAV